MLSPVMISILLQVGVVILLSVGFTFTYMVEKFPNFAHTAICSIGTLVAFTLVRIYGLNPYQTWPIATLVGGLSGVGLYFLVVRPIKATGTREITLTFAFFAIAQIIGSLISIYSYWFLFNQGYPTAGFSVQGFDFTWSDYPGVFLVALPTCVVLVAVLYFFLTRVRYGIALRAVAEDEALASSLGVNIFFIHILSWFLTGALAGLAGAIIPLWRNTGLGFNDTLLILVMAGSVIGGLNSVTGAVVGGLLVAILPKFLSAVLMFIFNRVFIEYEALFPIIFIFVVLMIEPDGIMGILNRPHSPRRTLNDAIHRLKSLYNRVFHGV